MDKFEKVIRKIEKQEKTWRYVLSDEEAKKHSYGRVPEDKNVVAFWSVPRSTAELLEAMVKFTKAKVIFELGCSAGYSTLFLARGAKANGGHVYTTEILPVKIRIAKKHFREAGLSKYITLIEGDILDVLKNWNKDKKFDLVFMDADKERYSVYLDLLIPLLNKKGVIIVDNASKVRMPDGRLIEFPPMKKFIDKVRRDKRLESVLLDFDNGLLIIAKKH